MNTVHRVKNSLMPFFRSSSRMAHYRRLVACFSDPLQETHCLFLGSLYTDNLSLISYFRLEEGQQLIFHPVYSAYKGNIFDIWKNLFRWQGPFNKAKLSSTGTGLAYWNWACNNLRLSTRYLLTKYDHFQADLYFSEWVGGVGGWGCGNNQT